MHERNLMRGIHLVSSAAIGTFVYSPWRNEPLFLLSMRVLIIPILTLTGLWMWQGQQLKKQIRSSQQNVKAS